MCLIEHGAEFIQSSYVPAEVAVISDGIGNPHDDITRSDAGTHFAAVGERREPTRILGFGKRVERLEQVGDSTRTSGQSCGEIGLIANRPDGDGGMVIVLTDQFGELLSGVGGKLRTR